MKLLIIKINFLVCLFITSYSALSTGQVNTAESELEIIHRQFVAYHTREAANNKEISQWLSAFENDGRWKDIDYTNDRMGDWPRLNHLIRVRLLSQAFIDADSIFFQNKQVIKVIEQALAHWINHDYGNKNWWYHRIAIPENMLISFILLEGQLPPMLLTQAKKIFNRSRIAMTGQNRVWLAGIAFMKAYLARDVKLMNNASDTIWSELKVSTHEGIQPDWSFHQHGPQLQIGTYGLLFTERMTMWLSLLNNTQFTANQEKQNILRHYLLGALRWVSWKERLDLFALGRRIIENSQVDTYQRLKSVLQLSATFDSANQNDYLQAIQPESNLVGHRSFWRSEFAIQREKNWYASIKMSSTRMIGAETANAENMQGLHLGDGTLLIVKSGDEYENIVPLWNWHRLPGTTTDQGFANLTPKGWNQSYGGTDYSGVLGDEQGGLTATVYHRNRLNAQKSCYLSSDAISCLGSNIRGVTKGSVFTAIEQTYLTGVVNSSNGVLKKGQHFLEAGSWVHHNGIGYYLSQAAVVSLETVQGNWLSSYPEKADRPVVGDIFSIWFDHGQSPKNSSYAYRIYPDILMSDMSARIAQEQNQILKQTVNVHAVEHNNIIKAAFFNVGEFTTLNGTIIKVNQPCLLSLKGQRLMVSDPTHYLSELLVTIAGSEYRIHMPKADKKGSPVIIDLTLF